MITICFLSFILFFFIVGGIIFYQSQNIKAYTAGFFQHQYQWKNDLDNLSRQIVRSDLLLNRYLLTQKSQYEGDRKKVWQNIRQLDQQLHVQDSLLRDKQVHDVWRRIQLDLNHIEQQQGEIIEKLEQQHESTLSDYTEQLEPLNYQVLNTIQDLQKSINKSTGNAEKLISNRFNQQALIMPVLSLIYILLAFFFYRLLTRKVFSAIDNVKMPLEVLSKGNLPPQLNFNQDELDPVVKEIEHLSHNFANIKDFALEVGKGNFDSDINVFNNEGEIGKSLFEMRNSLKNVAEDERERSWGNEGFAQFGDILRNFADNLELLSENVISHLVKYLKANQGGMFILKQADQDEPVLELSACYAYERKKYLNKTVAPGVGLVGQCYLEQESIYIRDIPSDYVNITSGLGKANPRNLFLVPLKINAQVFGVIEIASFNDFQQYELDFIEKVAESIASAIASTKTNQNTRRLLEESQLAAEQLKAQEEEMRQNMEELAATQEEMQRNQNSIMYNEQKIRLIYENAFDAIITLDQKGIIDLFNPAAEQIFGYGQEEVAGKSIEILMPDEVAAIHHRHMDNAAESEKSIVGVPREIKAKRRNGDLFNMRIKIEKAMIAQDIIYIAFIEDATEEVKQQLQMKEEQEQLRNMNAQLSQQLDSKPEPFPPYLERIPMIWIDKENNIDQVNQAFERLSQMKQKDLLNKPIQSVISDWPDQIDQPEAWPRLLHFSFNQQERYAADYYPDLPLPGKKMLMISTVAVTPEIQKAPKTSAVKPDEQELIGKLNRNNERLQQLILKGQKK